MSWLCGYADVEGMDVYEVEEAFAGNEYELYEQLLIVSRYLTLEQILALRLKNKRFQYWLHHSLNLILSKPINVALTHEKTQFHPLLRVITKRVPGVNTLLMNAVKTTPPTVSISVDTRVGVELPDEVQNVNLPFQHIEMYDGVYFLNINEAPTWVHVKSIDPCHFMNVRNLPNVENIIDSRDGHICNIEKLPKITNLVCNSVQDKPVTIDLPSLIKLSISRNDGDIRHKIICPNLEILNIRDANFSIHVCNLFIFPKLRQLIYGPIGTGTTFNFIPDEEYILGETNIFQKEE